MLFNGLGLPVTSWRLILVEMLPTEWIWAVTVDLKAHALSGKQFHDIREPVVLVLLAAVVLITSAAFAFAISQARIPGPAGRRAQAPHDGHRLGHRHGPGAGPRGGDWAGSRCCPASSWPS